MNMKNSNRMIENVFFFAMGEEYKSEVERSQGLFVNIINDEVNAIEKGYNSWLVFDFRLESGVTFLEEYASKKASELSPEDLEQIKYLREAVFSVFEVVENNGKRFLKDISTNKDYMVIEIEEWEPCVLKARLVKAENGYELVEGYETYQIEFKDVLRKGIFAKYNEYCSSVEPINIADFIKEHSVILYRLLDIIDELLEDEKNDFCDMYVHQGNYAVKNYKELVALLEASELVNLIEEFDGVKVYRFTGDNETLCEIAVGIQKMEIECNDEDSLSRSKIILESIVEGMAQFLNYEVLGFDDLM